MELEKVIKIDGHEVQLIASKDGIEIYRAVRPINNTNRFPTYIVKKETVIMKFDTESWNLKVETL